MKYQISNIFLHIRNSLAKQGRGFTLIELLVTIGIIGVLATIGLTNYVAIQQKARDATRKKDLLAIQAALELYRSDVGRYPAEDGGQQKLTAASTNCTPTSLTPLSSGSVTYLKGIPCDPFGYDTNKYNHGYYYYDTDATGSQYTLAACLENANDNTGTNTDPSPAASFNPTGCSVASGGTDLFYIVTNP